MIRRHLSYANVTATLALVFAMAGGAAYAVDKVNSRDIVNASIRSIDLKNHKGVRKVDVKHDSLTGRQIDEETLKVAPIARLAGDETGNCDPDSSTTFTICTRTALFLERRSRVLVIATGNQESVGGPAEARCQVIVDGVREPLGVLPGEQSTDNTSVTATNGFARTVVPGEALGPGSHRIAFGCQEFSGNARIHESTIAVVAAGVP